MKFLEIIWDIAQTIFCGLMIIVLLIPAIYVVNKLPESKIVIGSVILLAALVYGYCWRKEIWPEIKDEIKTRKLIRELKKDK